jgi:hypothetical protein
METAECGAGLTRSQTQEEGLARENSIAAMLLEWAVFSARYIDK